MGGVRDLPDYASRPLPFAMFYFRHSTGHGFHTSSVDRAGYVGDGVTVTPLLGTVRSILQLNPIIYWVDCPAGAGIVIV